VRPATPGSFSFANSSSSRSELANKCALYRSWEARLSPTMRWVHAAGERLFVEYTGRTVEVADGSTSELDAEPAGLDRFACAHAGIPGRRAAPDRAGLCSPPHKPDNLRASGQPINTGTAAGKAFLKMLGVFAEFETNLRKERQAEGIAAAKARGVYRGRKPKIASRYCPTARHWPGQHLSRAWGEERGIVARRLSLPYWWADRLTKARQKSQLPACIKAILAATATTGSSASASPPAQPRTGAIASPPRRRQGCGSRSGAAAVRVVGSTVAGITDASMADPFRRLFGKLFGVGPIDRTSSLANDSA
jgi:hypothetical protein